VAVNLTQDLTVFFGHIVRQSGLNFNSPARFAG